MGLASLPGGPPSLPRCPVRVRVTQLDAVIGSERDKDIPGGKPPEEADTRIGVSDANLPHFLRGWSPDLPSETEHERGTVVTLLPWQHKGAPLNEPGEPLGHLDPPVSSSAPPFHGP
jgi:hypothetical protein